MSRLIDMSAWDDQHSRSTALVREIARAYVLVADADLQRAAACLESIKPFNVGVLVAPTARRPSASFSVSDRPFC